MNMFGFSRSSSLQEASAFLSRTADAKILAGGHTLIPTMKQGLATPSDLVDVSAIPDLQGIAFQNGILTIGAMSRHAEVAESELVRHIIPALAGLAGGIGDPHVRCRGTIGGSVANNDPSADYPAACLALNATVITTKREIRAEKFFVGMFETALDADEIIIRIAFPAVERAGYKKFPHPASRYPLVGVFVAKRAEEVRVAVTGAGQSVFRAYELEKALTKSFSADSLEGVCIDSDGLNSDIHADAKYRAHLVGVMAKRAVTVSLERNELPLSEQL